MHLCTLIQTFKKYGCAKKCTAIKKKTWHTLRSVGKALADQHRVECLEIISQGQWQICWWFGDGGGDWRGGEGGGGAVIERGERGNREMVRRERAVKRRWEWLDCTIKYIGIGAYLCNLQKYFNNLVSFSFISVKASLPTFFLLRFPLNHSNVLSSIFILEFDVKKKCAPWFDSWTDRRTDRQSNVNRTLRAYWWIILDAWVSLFNPRFISSWQRIL